MTSKHCHPASSCGMHRLLPHLPSSDQSAALMTLSCSSTDLTPSGSPSRCDAAVASCGPQAHSEAMETLLTAAAGGKPKPALVFVGATVQADLAATAAQMGWMEDPVTVAVGQVQNNDRGCFEYNMNLPFLIP